MTDLVLVLLIVLFLFSVLMMIWRRGILWAIVSVFIPVALFLEGVDIILVIVMLFISGASLMIVLRSRV